MLLVSDDSWHAFVVLNCRGVRFGLFGPFGPVPAALRVQCCQCVARAGQNSSHVNRDESGQRNVSNANGAALTKACDIESDRERGGGGVTHSGTHSLLR